MGFSKRDVKVSDLHYFVNSSHEILRRKFVKTQRCIKLVCLITCASLANLKGTKVVPYPARYSLPNAGTGCYITASSIIELLRDFITPPPQSFEISWSARFLSKAFESLIPLAPNRISSSY